MLICDSVICFNLQLVVCTYVCVCLRLLLRITVCGFVWSPPLSLVLYCPCQWVMAYLLLIETATGDSDTPIMAFNVPGHQ